MSDPYRNSHRGLESPGMCHASITPSNTADLPVRPRVLYCQAAGNVALRDETGADITYAVTQGQVLPFSPVRVLATGTTATVIGWW